MDTRLNIRPRKLQVIYMMQKKIRTAVFFTALFLSMVSMHSPDRYDDMEKEILHFVNLDRKSNGLKPLELNSFESSVALEHSRNMASGKTPFGHKGMEARIK